MSSVNSICHAVINSHATKNVFVIYIKFSFKKTSSSNWKICSILKQKSILHCVDISVMMDWMFCTVSFQGCSAKSEWTEGSALSSSASAIITCSQPAPRPTAVSSTEHYLIIPYFLPNCRNGDAHHKILVQDSWHIWHLRTGVCTFFYSQTWRLSNCLLFLYPLICCQLNMCWWKCDKRQLWLLWHWYITCCKCITDKGISVFSLAIISTNFCLPSLSILGVEGRKISSSVLGSFVLYNCYYLMMPISHKFKRSLKLKTLFL